MLTVPANAFSHAFSLAAIFAGVALCTWATKFEVPAGSAVRRGGLSACVFDFLDLLTTPTIPLALTAAVTAAVAFRRTDSTGARRC